MPIHMELTYTMTCDSCGHEERDHEMMIEDERCSTITISTYDYDLYRHPNNSDNILCSTCYHEEFTSCDYCGDDVARDDAVIGGDEEYTYCCEGCAASDNNPVVDTSDRCRHTSMRTYRHKRRKAA